MIRGRSLIVLVGAIACIVLIILLGTLDTAQATELHEEQGATFTPTPIPTNTPTPHPKITPRPHPGGMGNLPILSGAVVFIMTVIVLILGSGLVLNYKKRK